MASPSLLMTLKASRGQTAGGLTMSYGLGKSFSAWRPLRLGAAITWLWWKAALGLSSWLLSVSVESWPLLFGERPLSDERLLSLRWPWLFSASGPLGTSARGSGSGYRLLMTGTISAVGAGGVCTSGRRASAPRTQLRAAVSPPSLRSTLEAARSASGRSLLEERVHPLCVPLVTTDLTARSQESAQQIQPSLEEQDCSERPSGSTCSSQSRSWRWSSCTRRDGRGAGLARTAEQEKELKPEQEVERMQRDGRRR
ncbi:hypothetical protein DV515_00014174 [Chloebia gouldiae]|uniref:Uncharacterized protein n=1 Tax=Chloebia gouldiae TaxID=44316 RepID=A0A3L8RZ89_CHLGU|nr:hypothetical protein DV515_00014174 [Chloebia gouldiae]